MPNPKEFYYSELQSSVSYGDTPTGSLDVGRLIRGQPCWVVTSMPREPKPKKLILADWSASSWSVENIFKIGTELARLMREGFLIYIWQDGRVIPLTAEGLPFLVSESLRHGITPAYPEDIIETAVRQQKLARDQIYILDDYGLSHLLHPEGGAPLQQRSLVLSALEYINSSKMTEDARLIQEQKRIGLLVEIMSKATPPLRFIIHDEFSNTKNYLYKDFIKTFPLATIKPEYKKITLKWGAGTAFVREGSITIDGFILSVDNVRAVESFDLESCIFTDTKLGKILGAAFSIKILNLSNSAIFPGTFTTEVINLSKLELLNLNESTIHILDFQKALSGSPALKALHLHKSKVLSEVLTLEPVSLAQLEFLDLKETTLLSSSICQLFVAAPNIVSLDLSGAFEFIGELHLLPGSLLRLEFLNVSQTVLKAADLKKFLNAAPNIKMLNLDGCRPLDMVIEARSLPRLEVLSLNMSGITSLNLQQFLEAAPALNTLNLHKCHTITGALHLAKGSLPHLHMLNLSSSTLRPANLQQLLVAAPGLQILNLEYYESLPGELSLERGCLPALAFLNLNGSSITSPLLLNLLGAATSLKSIDLSACEVLEGEFHIEPDSLPKLEYINLGANLITAANLKKIFLAAPNLTTISLKKAVGFTERLTIPPNSLPKLVYLNLDSTFVTADNLQQLLVAAPALKTLILDNCSALGGEFRLEKDSLAHLEHLHLKRSTVSAANLQYLLAAAPALNSLNLERCGGLSEPFVIAPESLLKLKELNASATPITMENLQQLLTATPKLKQLDLSNCRNLIGELHLPKADHSLLHLQGVSLNFTFFSTTNLRTLLVAAPNLVSLNLYGAGGLAEDLILTKKSLSRLEYLNAGASSITLRNLQNLLAAAPGLKKLILEGHGRLEGGLTLESGSLSLLEDLNLDNSSITTTNLEQLLAAAPSLEKLSLNNCKNLNGEFNIEAGSLPNLKYLHLNKSNITATNLKKLLAAAPNLQTLYLTDVKNLVIDDELNDLLKNVQYVTLPVSERIDSAADATVPALPAIEDASFLPPHNPAENKDFVPTAADAPFKFLGKNRTKDQGMIIEKFSQYLTLNGRHMAVIPRLQDGICNALTHFFHGCEPGYCEDAIDEIYKWPGTAATLTDDLIRLFDTLYAYVDAFQLHPIAIKKRYLGDNLDYFLSSCKTTSILGNPWHVIAIRPVDEDVWEVYDPNYLGGVRMVATDILKETIQHAIGNVVYVESTDASLVPRIENPASFMEEGGLLALCMCVEPEVMLEQLRDLEYYPTSALDGLLLRDMGGVPAWVLGIENAILSPYTQDLLGQFIKKHPDDYAGLLQRSMACLTPLQKQEAMTCLIQTYVRSTGPMALLRDELLEVIRTSPVAPSYYERQLQTWRATTSITETLPAYCQECIAKAGVKKRLIELSSSEQVASLQWALQKQAQSILHRPVFYINSPDDLISSAPYIEHIADGSGILRTGPGGPLYDFLKACKAGDAPVLIVNYDHFHADDIVRFNGLLDKERHADGTPLPTDMTVIGLINTNKPDCYQGSDFYSRFDRVEKCPLSKDLLNHAVPNLPIIDKPAAAPPGNVINLYHAPDWKERLLGRWVMSRDKLTFEEGALARAIAKGGDIELQNAPWGDEEFNDFWRQAFLTGFVADGRIAIPVSLKLIRSEGYDWDDYKKLLKIERGLSENAAVLNPGRLGEFFDHYSCDASALVHQPGLIEVSAGKILDVNVTHPLNSDEWAMILSACKTHGVLGLTTHVAPGVDIPDTLEAAPLVLSPAPRAWDKTTNPTQVISSTDIDTTVAQLTADSDWTVIDISETKPSDLLRRIEGALIPGEPPAFRFAEYPSLLKEALARGKKVILKGRFSKELAEELAPVLLARHTPADSPGFLTLVSDDTRFLNYFPVQSHIVNVSEKVACLGELNSTIAALLAPVMTDESLSQLKTRRDLLLSRPDTISSNVAWEGLHHLTGGVSGLGVFDVATSAAETLSFTKERRDAVNKVLAYAPYVFLTGLSGVGKSTFVNEEFCQEDDKLYTGEANVNAWATDTSDALHKILFIDEANLSPKEWSEFEGLFNTPPTILIKGVLHTLTPAHKVIFAGNPVSYGDERKLSPLFLRHGHAVLFSPLTPAVIYEKSLKPVFADTPLMTSAAVISSHIFKIYDFLCACSTTDVLISPRELQMMALLVKAHQQRHPTVDLDVSTSHIVYQLAAHLVPQEKYKEFERRFKPVIALPLDMPTELSGFLITPSRQPIWQQLDDRLSLRELRRGTAGNDAQQYGGLGGIVIEGEPGVGKSELVVSALVARGYHEVHDFTRPVLHEKPFYRMPVSMPVKEKEALLRKAFDEGAVVVIDEINSSPMMERLLNDLLMGKTPENKRPTHPGFMVIGTQNPVTMAGRRAASTALARRLTTVELPVYSQDEIKSILMAKGITTADALSISVAYQKQVDYAKKHHLMPPPTFRDVLKLADQIIAGNAIAIALGEGIALEAEKDAEPELSIHVARGFWGKTAQHTGKDKSKGEEASSTSKPT